MPARYYIKSNFQIFDFWQVITILCSKSTLLFPKLMLSLILKRFVKVVKVKIGIFLHFTNFRFLIINLKSDFNILWGGNLADMRPFFWSKIANQISSGSLDIQDFRLFKCWVKNGGAEKMAEISEKIEIWKSTVKWSTIIVPFKVWAKISLFRY